MMIHHLSRAAEMLDCAIDETADSAERKLITNCRDVVLKILQTHGMFVGMQPHYEPGNIVEIPEMPWCAACKSYHVTPKTKEHHAALQCFAPWKEPEQP